MCTALQLPFSFIAARNDSLPTMDRFDGSWRPITTAIFEVMRHFSLLTVCAQSKFGALSAPQALSAAPFDRRGEN